MEAGDSTSRQSGHPSASTSTTSERPSLPHQSPFQPSREPSSMASASVLPTGNSFQQPAFPNSRPGSGGSGISKLMSSNDALRKPSEDNDAGRQSLPSISEVISATKPQFPQPPPSSSSLPPSSSLPSPFPPAARAYAESDPRGSPHPASFPARQENLGSFSSSPRSASFSGRPGLPPIPDRRSSPHRPDGQAHGVNDPHAHNGGYAHHSQPPPPPPPPLAMGYQQNGHLPAGQVPLPGYTASPRHAGPPPPPPGPYDPRSSQHDDIDLSTRQRYESTVNRHFENWGYTDTLTRVAASSRTVFNFAEAYGRLASETNSTHPHTDRMPSDREVGDMLANVELMKQSLEQIRDVVQASIRKERALVGANAKMGGYDDQEDVSMCADGLKPPYPIGEVKKRRGRAAPPGRCHSCNRIDTPEWRRGPDGARTLCNACGLHYAKLERKRQLEARSIRPKPEDRAS